MHITKTVYLVGAHRLAAADQRALTKTSRQLRVELRNAYDEQSMAALLQELACVNSQELAIITVSATAAHVGLIPHFPAGIHLTRWVNERYAGESSNGTRLATRVYIELIIDDKDPKNWRRKIQDIFETDKRVPPEENVWDSTGCHLCPTLV